MDEKDTRQALAADDPKATSEPIFNIPGILLALIALMAGIHAVRAYVLTPQADEQVLLLFAFLPQRYLYPLGDQDLGWLFGPVGYSLLHGGWLHLIFNTAWLVAFAAQLVRRIGTLRFLLLWICSAVAAAFFQAFVTGFAASVLVGASGVVSATVGAACRFSLRFSGSAAMRYAEYAPRLGIVEALTHRAVLTFVVIWALSNALLAYGAGLPSGAGDYNIAWQAHVGGFLFGYLFFAAFDRHLPIPDFPHGRR